MHEDKVTADQTAQEPFQGQGNTIYSQIRTVFRTGYLRNIFLLSLAIAIVFPLANRFILYPLFADFVTEITEQEAQRSARHLEFALGIQGEGKISLPEKFTSNAPEIIASLDLIKVKVFNATGEIIYSTDAEDIGQLNKNDYFHNIVAQGHLFTKLIRKNTPSLEGDIVRLDVVETYVPILSSGEGKKFLGAFEIYFDVTERMARVDRLLNLSSYILAAVALGLMFAVIWTLRSAVAVSIQRDNAERAMILEKDRAELANRSKSEFLANMSHELRTPLNSVIGFSEALNHELFGSLGSDQNKEYVVDIHRSGKFLLELINDILDISRIEAGELDLEEENVDVTAVISGILLMVKGRAEKGGVKVWHENLSTNCHVFLDARQFKQILLNLLSNSIKFTKPGGDVTITSDIGSDGAFILSIKDTGIGIDSKHQALVMEPFGQVAGSLTRREEGTGLGLPIVKSLVANHGGTFELESEVGIGTTVTITIPKDRVLCA
ncbi:sensor histidine kinase [Kiloniella sp.]|uniref:sensor histidine kinase n=1 Tax=Kiloniella sp. TaxID=1938587 RepID=UPI003B01E284